MRMPVSGPVLATRSSRGRSASCQETTGADLLASAVNHLLVVGCYLVNLGYVSIALETTDTVTNAQSAMEALSMKVGTVVLILGACCTWRTSACSTSCVAVRSWPRRRSRVRRSLLTGSGLSDESARASEASTGLYADVVAGAKDVERSAELCEVLPELLWLHQMGIVLFWCTTARPVRRRRTSSCSARSRRSCGSSASPATASCEGSSTTCSRSSATWVADRTQSRSRATTRPMCMSSSRGVNPSCAAAIGSSSADRLSSP